MRAVLQTASSGEVVFRSSASAKWGGERALRQRGNVVPFVKLGGRVGKAALGAEKVRRLRSMEGKEMKALSVAFILVV